ncbi:hypothetical protein CC80DRAFT_595883 [Byssothecium circinans]|uniref:SAP domain-containing protein n=1 Tax=Byssothecium circinans TaxID=147558 RepID=A0A6A5TK97_9PLEO|nr:hypothetical protein CC80DRAFT_595883 [Byssothecium circinans]
MENVAPQPEPQPGPQPDFQRLTGALQDIATEYEKLVNLPPIAESAAIMQHIQEMQRQIQQTRTDITTDRRVTEYNSIARIQNSSVRKSDTPLTALRDYTTNADIPGFPATSAHLSNMSGPALDNVLTALGLPTNGSTEEKEKELRFYIGLKDPY